MTNNNPTPTPSAPTHIVWFVPERDHAPWQRLGAMWPTKSGKGFSMTLDLMPVAPGKIVVLPNEPKAKAEGEGA